MTQYHLTPSATLPSLIAQERKAARKKVLEAARKRERASFKAMMQRKRQLQASSDLV
jgi:hypothetical protein